MKFTKSFLQFASVSMGTGIVRERVSKIYKEREDRENGEEENACMKAKMRGIKKMRSLR